MSIAVWSSLAAWLGAAVYAGLALGGQGLGRVPRLIVWVSAWWLHGLALAGSLFAHPIYFGFGPALSATAWLVLCVYAIESRALPQLQSHRATLVLASLAIVLAQWSPGHPLPPTTSFLQPLHWLLGIASYGLFAAAVLHGLLTSAAERRIRMALEPYSGLPVLTLERLTFHLVTAGCGALTLTLLLALVSALESGHHSEAAWRWDHKTVLSLLSWMMFVVLLIGRHFAGWRGPKALRFLYLGATCLFLAYIGSHFVKDIILQR